MLESERSRDRHDAFAKALQAYLAATLHTPVQLRIWPKGRALPVFLTRRYRFYEAEIAQRPCLFLSAPEPQKPTPNEIARNIEAVRSNFDGIVAFATKHLSSTLRAHLIANGTPFVVPGNQLYIPQLAMDLREHFRSPERTVSARLSPVAQAVLFHHILKPRNAFDTPSGLASVLPYTPMSLGRAFDELAAHNLATVEKSGRQKTIRYNAGPRALVDLSKTLLRRPARGVHAVRFEGERPKLLLAGETALAEMTDLAPPRRPTYAIDGASWQAFFKRHRIVDYNDEYEGEAIIETWRYDPKILSRGRTVDPLSLYAEFWESPDERVARAAADLLEKLEW